MRRLGFLFILFSSVLSLAQKADNRFEEAEYNSVSSGMGSKQNNTFVTSSQPSEPSMVSVEPGVANPADTVPVDDYIPILLLIALGIIVQRVYIPKKTV